MDTDKQLYEIEATGWQKGLYDDIKQTFRAPFINWIFRTNMANHPELFRHVWFQLKPLFTTKQFAKFTVAYRDAVLSACESKNSLPTYRREQLSLRPAEYRELREQLATFDTVAPRLAVLFEVMDRVLHDEPVADNTPDEAATTEPFPDWLDRNRGSQPSMIGFKEIPTDLDETVSSIQAFHGYEDSLPSIYRCGAQWPAFLRTAWGDLSPIVDDDGFEELYSDAYGLVEDYARQIPYQPQVRIRHLEQAGFERDRIDGMKTLFREFNRGAIAAQTIVPFLHILAAMVGAEGVRTVP